MLPDNLWDVPPLVIPPNDPNFDVWLNTNLPPLHGRHVRVPTSLNVKIIAATELRIVSFLASSQKPIVRIWTSCSRLNIGDCKCLGTPVNS